MASRMSGAELLIEAILALLSFEVWAQKLL